MTDRPTDHRLNNDAEDAAVLRAILDAAVDAIITIDDRGIILNANAATERMFGYSRIELAGGNVSLIMPSPYREEHDGYLRRYAETNRAEIIGVGREVTGRHKDGSLIPIDLAVTESIVGGRRLFTGILRDMSERQRVETALRREKHFSRDLETTANAIVLILDYDGRIVRINPYAEQLTGYRLDEVEGKDWFETFVPADDQAPLRKLFRTIVAGTPVSSHVNAILTKGGDVRQIAWSSRQLIDSDEIIEGVLGIGTDVTDLMEAENRLIQSERLAAIGQMVTGLAHESRNALQRARGCLDLLELDVEGDSGELDLVHRTQQALDELQRLYDEVRSYAAPLKLDCCECNLGQLCWETWQQVHEAHNHPAIELHSTLSETGPHCHCDRARIQQVLRNVFENAVHVSPEPSEVYVSAEVVPGERRSLLRLRIRDQGPGLNPDLCERIFEPFYTTKTKGTGLGLAISRRIMEAHGGGLDARAIESGSTGQTGTEVVLTLPQQVT